jgi:hypothetical protein
MILWRISNYESLDGVGGLLVSALAHEGAPSRLLHPEPCHGPARNTGPAGDRLRGSPGAFSRIEDRRPGLAFHRKDRSRFAVAELGRGWERDPSNRRPLAVGKTLIAIAGAKCARSRNVECAVEPSTHGSSSSENYRDVLH